MIEFKTSFKTMLSNSDKSSQGEMEKSFTPMFTLPTSGVIIDRRARIPGTRFKSRLIEDRPKKDGK